MVWEAEQPGIAGVFSRVEIYNMDISLENSVRIMELNDVWGYFAQDETLNVRSRPNPLNSAQYFYAFKVFELTFVSLSVCKTVTKCVTYQKIRIKYYIMK